VSAAAKSGYYAIIEESNPFGTIPFAIYRARPSALIGGAGAWFALSDINEAQKILEFLLERFNDLDITSRYQAFAVFVVEMNDDMGDSTSDAVTFSPKDPFVVSGGSASWQTPNAPISDVMAMIDQVYQWAFEVEGVPMVSVRTMESSETGVAVKIKMRPLQELTEERRKRHSEAEKMLWIYTLMAHNIWVEGQSYTWEEARKFIQEQNEKVHVEHADDYNPVDEQEDLETIDLAGQLGMVTEFEKWRRTHPNGSEEDFEEWLREKKRWDDKIKEIKGEGQGITLPEAPPEGAEDLDIERLLAQPAQEAGQ
jgi:hypothetical protein